MMASDLIIIKFGGSLITDKSKICTPKIDVIQKICTLVSQLNALGKKVIVVHGAGSYGHIKAKKWRLSEGLIPELKDQLSALNEVREDMKTLNDLIIKCMLDNSIEVHTYRPHEHGNGIGINYKFSKFFDEILNSENTPVVYGDVVESEDDRNFGILSGDDICEILTRRYSPKHVIFAIDGAEGIIEDPNSNHSSIIKKYVLGTKINTIDVENDVTGGMKLKILRASNCLKLGSRVSIINGNNIEMILNSVLGLDYIGTEFVL
ncbi:MAG: hypothetical protein CMA27_03870 [Euryarchaeota archaeon]|nr:hypothetical protein [Euryarchaeota archaeon]